MNIEDLGIKEETPSLFLAGWNNCLTFFLKEKGTGGKVKAYECLALSLLLDSCYLFFWINTNFLNSKKVQDLIDHPASQALIASTRQCAFISNNVQKELIEVHFVLKLWELLFQNMKNMTIVRGLLARKYQHFFIFFGYQPEGTKIPLYKTINSTFWLVAQDMHFRKNSTYEKYMNNNVLYFYFWFYPNKYGHNTYFGWMMSYNIATQMSYNITTQLPKQELWAPWFGWKQTTNKYDFIYFSNWLRVKMYFSYILKKFLTV